MRQRLRTFVSDATAFAIAIKQKASPLVSLVDFLFTCLCIFVYHMHRDMVFVCCWNSWIELQSHWVSFRIHSVVLLDVAAVALIWWNSVAKIVLGHTKLSPSKGNSKCSPTCHAAIHSSCLSRSSANRFTVTPDGIRFSTLRNSRAKEWVEPKKSSECFHFPGEEETHCMNQSENEIWLSIVPTTKSSVSHGKSCSTMWTPGFHPNMSPTCRWLKNGCSSPKFHAFFFGGFDPVPCQTIGF